MAISRTHRVLSIDDIPDRHKDLPSGSYKVAMESGVEFELRVDNSQRALTGTEMMRASVHNISRGRPQNAFNPRVDRNDLMILIPGLSRKDIQYTDTGVYRYGQIASRSLREAVSLIVEAYAPKNSAPRL